MSKRFIPFGWMPGHWGLVGQTRARAEIEYNNAHDPHRVKVELAKLELTGVPLRAALLDLQEEAGELSDQELSIQRIDLLTNAVERDIAQLAHDRKYSEMSDLEYEKRLATLKKEPWVNVVDLAIDAADPRQGDFELDWNEFFIAKLEESGYVGKDEDEVIQQWFHEICKNVALDVYDGVGDFNERTDPPKLRNNKTKKTKLPNGTKAAE